ncbi:MAG: hypothetical protein AB7O98_17470 [Hyphomonadaceae bacterium]
MTTDEPDDRFDRNRPHQLAQMIVSYWAALGYVVNVTVTRSTLGPQLRSDLVNGLPRNWRGWAGDLIERGLPSEGQARERNCIKCGTAFESEHNGHRMCTLCNYHAPDVVAVGGGNTGKRTQAKT